MDHFKENISSNENTSSKDMKKKKIRCFQCKKKLMLMQQIKCQCDQYFCPCHMNRHSHNCSCNVKEETKRNIEKNNPKMNEKMIDKI